jgi:imidazole glycerol-phosphate synthase
LQTIEVGEKSLPHCIDEDGTNSDFDLEFVKHLGGNVSIPLFVSSGTGKVEHFSKVFEKTNVEASLAAYIFYREKAAIEAIKEHMRERVIEAR